MVNDNEGLYHPVKHPLLFIIPLVSWAHVVRFTNFWGDKSFTITSYNHCVPPNATEEPRPDAKKGQHTGRCQMLGIQHHTTHLLLGCTPQETQASTTSMQKHTICAPDMDGTKHRPPS
jgi:hypothetical protein